MHSSSQSAHAHAPSAPENTMAAYKIGDRDTRPWGHYIVTGAGITDTGEEYCEKLITIKPWQILSLQSHNLRRETWTVKKGTLVALRDGQRIEVPEGDSVVIPMGSLHCMANMDEDDCVVEERQEGICREEDIKRYMDAYQRGTEKLASPAAADSFASYREVQIDINKIKANRAQSVPY